MLLSALVVDRELIINKTTYPIDHIKQSNPIAYKHVNDEVAMRATKVLAPIEGAVYCDLYILVGEMMMMTKAYAVSYSMME